MGDSMAFWCERRRVVRGIVRQISRLRTAFDSRTTPQGGTQATDHRLHPVKLGRELLNSELLRGEVFADYARVV